MKIKKILLLFISGLIMTTALVTGLTGNRDMEMEHLFEKQVFAGDGMAAVQAISTQDGILAGISGDAGAVYLSQPDVLVMVSLALFAFFVFAIYLAKKNGLYITGRGLKQYTGKELHKGLQYDQ